MNLSAIKPYLQFSRTQRIGLLFLLAFIVVFQMLYFFVDFAPMKSTTAAKQQWLSVQKPTNSKSLNNEETHKIYPYNPNFITDFKGYKLGMSVAEIDRLLAYRKTNRYVNSPQEFQQVTGVSDSLLAVMVPYFKFPDWVKNKKQYASYQKPVFEKKESKVQLDINLATQEDLKKVYGIGDGLSERILKEKEKLGGFVNMDQMKDVWGLSPEVVENLQKGFKVASLPAVKKIKINDASLQELLKFPYFRYALSKSIITYRSMNGPIKSPVDLINISGFPLDKVEIIALYLEF